MRNLAINGAVATALSVILTPAALASGWIVVDPITPRIALPRPITPISPISPIRPIHPIGIITPPQNPPVRPGQPLLHGNVSFGLHLQAEDVKVDVNGPVARTYITQTFSNDSDQILAGTYLFPLPDDCTFSSFTLEIDGKPVEGKILEAQEARTEYEGIVRRMVDPGLLEYADYKTVRARVFPIPAHGTKKIQLEYTQTMKAENGLYKYRFPLKAEENAEPASAIDVNVKLASPHGLKTIWSPTHIIAANREGDHKANIKYSAKNVLPDKDFCLYYSISDKDLNADLLAQKNGPDDGYFLLSVAPPVVAKTIEHKDIVLIADTSGSMQGEKLEECKKALKYVVNALNPGDRFGIIQFNTDAEPFKYSLVDATPENKKAALSFVEDLDAHGGTNIGEALHLGTSMLSSGDQTRPAYVVLMTDGEPTVGVTDADNLTKLPGVKRDVRLFDFGVGYDVNTKLLNKLADGHHGTAQYVEPNENLETVLSGFYQKIKSPVLSDVKISYDGVQVKDVYPKEVKDIFAGTQVLLIGKYKEGGTATVHVTGKVDGQSRQYNFPVTFPKEQSGHSYINRLWAMRRIGYLSDIAQANGNTREVIDEIVALSKKYGIISQYTSFLATDPEENARLRQMGFGGGIRPVAAMVPGQAGAGGGMPRRAMAMNRFDFAPNAFRAEASQSGIVRGNLMKSRSNWQVVDERPLVADRRSESKAMVAPMPAPMSAPGDMMYATSMPVDHAAFQQNSGRDAFKAAKRSAGLKESIALEKDAREGGVKSVEDKTFYLVNGFWTDSDFDANKSKPETIEFGSTKYFDLVKSNPELRKYLAVATQVIVAYKGHCYKIVQPGTATG